MATFTKDSIIGETLVEIRPLTQAERDENGWCCNAYALVFSNGTVVYPSQDAEGNGPGTLFVVSEKSGTYLL